MGIAIVLLGGLFSVCGGGRTAIHMRNFRYRVGEDATQKWHVFMGALVVE